MAEEEVLSTNRFTWDESQKTGDMGKVTKILQDEARQRVVYANIVAEHGDLSRPAPDWRGTPHSTPMLPNNVRLFIIATRGYKHLAIGGDPVEIEKHFIKYLKVLREGIEEESRASPFFTREGCLTTLGNKTLANMILVMSTNLTYSEYYGQAFPNFGFGGRSTRSWKSFQLKGEEGMEVGEDEWSSPFLTLKIYNDIYNEQRFIIDTEEVKKRFGVLFQYRDKDESIKNIFLHLIYAPSKNVVYLSEVLETIRPILELNLAFNFTHMSCRVDSSGEDSLTKQLSNKGSELHSKRCFINTFEEKYREGLKSALIGYATIYEFFNELKVRRLYDYFLNLLDDKERENIMEIKSRPSIAGDALFKFITSNARSTQTQLIIL